MGRMFPFVTCQPNPIGGCASCNYWDDENFRLCSFLCSYCWATDMKTRFKYPKYQGPWRWYGDVLSDYEKDDFPWPCDMIDIGDPTLPISLRRRLYRWISQQSCLVLLLTKNPRIYVNEAQYIPENAVIGATIETDQPLLSSISVAPPTIFRLMDMEWCADNLPNKRFICIEPVMKFSPDFEREISKTRPWAVAIGYDNYGNSLPEPSLDATKNVISELEHFTKVFIKTLRDPSLSMPQETG